MVTSTRLNCFVGALALMLMLSAPVFASDATEVVLETALGNIVISIDEEAAPLTAAYFLGYIDRGQYDGATLYRSASLDGGETPQIVQGGILQAALNSASPINPNDFGAQLLETIESTDHTGKRHLRGTVTLARDLLDTGYVIPEIVFCLREVPSMDAGGRTEPDAQGFPAFASIASGIDVVEAITRQDLSGATNIVFLQGQVLAAPVVIKRAYRKTP